MVPGTLTSARSNQVTFQNTIKKNRAVSQGQKSSVSDIRCFLLNIQAKARQHNIAAALPSAAAAATALAALPDQWASAAAWAVTGP